MNLFMTFIIYSVIGWLWETVYCLVKYKRFVFCGVLLGPYCPVYGCSIATILLLTRDIQNSHHLFLLYLFIVLIVTLIEYIGSWILEKLFNMKLWDYSNLPLNFQGRVALPISIFWGIGGLVLIKLINPVIQDFLRGLLTVTGDTLVFILVLIFLADVVSTFSFTLSAKKDFMRLLILRTIKILTWKNWGSSIFLLLINPQLIVKKYWNGLAINRPSLSIIT